MKITRITVMAMLMLSLAGTALAADDGAADNRALPAKGTQLFGSESVRYDHSTKNNVPTNKVKYKTIVGAQEKLGDNLVLKVSVRNETTFNNHKEETNTTFDETTLTYKNGTSRYVIGRMPYRPVYGLMVNSEFNGVKVTLGSGTNWRTTLWGGRDRYLAEQKTYNGVKYVLSSDVSGKENETNSILGIETALNVGHKLGLRAGTMSAHLEQSGQDARYNELGARWKFDSKLSLTVSYGKSDADNYNTANAFMLQYGEANMNKPGSFQVRIGTHRVEKFSALDSLYFKSTGYSEIEERLDYVVSKNVKVTFDYATGVNPCNSKDKFNGYHADLKVLF